MPPADWSADDRVKPGALIDFHVSAFCPPSTPDPVQHNRHPKQSHTHIHTNGGTLLTVNYDWVDQIRVTGPWLPDPSVPVFVHHFDVPTTVYSSLRTHTHLDRSSRHSLAPKSGLPWTEENAHHSNCYRYAARRPRCLLRYGWTSSHPETRSLARTRK